MPLKGKIIYTLLGVVLTVFVLYPTVKETFREQKVGLLLSPEEVKGSCGKPQEDEVYKLTYFDGDHRTELRFTGVQHRMFLTNVKWSSVKSGGTGEIRVVSQDAVSDYVKHSWLPACLEDATK